MDVTHVWTGPSAHAITGSVVSVADAPLRRHFGDRSPRHVLHRSPAFGGADPVPGGADPDSDLVSGGVDRVSRGVDPADFRRAVGRFATGVTVVTTVFDGRHVAMTANSFTSVSLEPVLVLVSVRKNARFHAPVLGAGVWGVSVLPANMSDASHFFAARDDRAGPHAFDRWKHSFGAGTGVLLFDDALAVFECRTVSFHDAGDHTLIIGEVVGLAEPAADAQPLVFYRGSYRQLEAEPVVDEDIDPST